MNVAAIPLFAAGGVLLLAAAILLFTHEDGRERFIPGVLLFILGCGALMVALALEHHR